MLNVKYLSSNQLQNLAKRIAEEQDLRNKPMQISVRLKVVPRVDLVDSIMMLSLVMDNHIPEIREVLKDGGYLTPKSDFRDMFIDEYNSKHYELRQILCHFFYFKIKSSESESRWVRNE